MMIQKVPITELFLPKKDTKWIAAGKTYVEWDVAVVYVREESNPYSPPTHLYFSCFGCSGDFYVTEALQFVDQWTWRRGRCNRYYQPEEREFRRARKLACQVIETYRYNYMKKHGSPPNPMMLKGTLDPAVHNRHADKVNRRLLGASYLQLKLQFDS